MLTTSPVHLAAPPDMTACPRALRAAWAIPQLADIHCQLLSSLLTDGCRAHVEHDASDPPRRCWRGRVQTHDLPEATYASVDNLRVTPRSARSFDSADVPSLESLVLQRSYTNQPAQGLITYGHYRRADRPINSYNSGSSVARGNTWAGAVHKLPRFGVEVHA